MTYEEQRAVEHAAELARPFPQLQDWSKDHQHRPLLLEPAVDCDKALRKAELIKKIRTCPTTSYPPWTFPAGLRIAKEDEESWTYYRDGTVTNGVSAAERDAFARQHEDEVDDARIDALTDAAPKPATHAGYLNELANRLQENPKDTEALDQLLYNVYTDEALLTFDGQFTRSGDIDESWTTEDTARVIADARELAQDPLHSQGPINEYGTYHIVKKGVVSIMLANPVPRSVHVASYKAVEEGKVEYTEYQTNYKRLEYIYEHIWNDRAAVVVREDPTAPPVEPTLELLDDEALLKMYGQCLDETNKDEQKSGEPSPEGRWVLAAFEHEFEARGMKPEPDPAALAMSDEECEAREAQAIQIDMQRPPDFWRGPEPAALTEPEQPAAALHFTSPAEFKAWAACATQQQIHAFWDGLSDLDFQTLWDDLDDYERCGQGPGNLMRGENVRSQEPTAQEQPATDTKPEDKEDYWANLTKGCVLVDGTLTFFLPPSPLAGKTQQEVDAYLTVMADKRAAQEPDNRLSDTSDEAIAEGIQRLKSCASTRNHRRHPPA